MTKLRTLLGNIGQMLLTMLAFAIYFMPVIILLYLAITGDDAGFAKVLKNFLNPPFP